MKNTEERLPEEQLRKTHIPYEGKQNDERGLSLQIVEKWCTLSKSPIHDVHPSHPDPFLTCLASHPLFCLSTLKPKQV